jgi:hypothetical protein
LLRHFDKSVKFKLMQRERIVRQLHLFTILLLLMAACTNKPRVGMDVDASSHGSYSRVLLSQPF